MAFVRVENFLARFLKFSKPEDLTPVVLGVLKKKLPGADFTLTIKRKVIYLSGLDAVLKSEVFSQRENILKELKYALGQRAPEEINFQKF